MFKLFSHKAEVLYISQLVDKILKLALFGIVEYFQNVIPKNSGLCEAFLQADFDLPVI